MYLRLTIALCCVIFLFSGCRFTPGDIDFVELEKPEEPELEIVELSLDRDTIFLTYYQDIQFHFSAGQHNVIQVGILIDGEEKYTRSNYKDMFTVLAADLDEGIHKLSFSVITNSNSGSIADLLGYEGFQFISNEWTLVCLKNDRMANFSKLETKNGKLELSWEPHEKVNFKRYRITKRRNDYSGAIKEYYTTEPYFIDEAYVGEKAHYDVYTEYYSSDDYYFQWAMFDIENTLPEIKIRTTATGQFEIYWTNNNFVEAIKNYRLINLVTPADTVTLQESLPNENNSYLIANGLFADEINYKLVVVPKHPENPFNNDEVYYHSKSYDGLIGEQTFSYNQVSSIDADEMLVRKDNYIYRYSINTENALDSLTYNWENCHVAYSGFTLSPQGIYFTTHESCNNNLVLMNPGNLKSYQSYPVSHVLTGGMQFSSMPVSDNGIVVVKDYERVSVYDVLNDNVIASYESNAYIGGLGISSNGNYFYVQTSQLDFYKIANNTLESVWQSPPAYNYIYSFFKYDPQNPENIILHDGESLYHKNAADFTTLKSFALKEELILNIDFPSRKLLAYSEDYLSVYSIDTGELLHRIQVNPRVARDQHHCTLISNKIYLKDGISIQLPTN
ncbi:hypothetical protein OU798_00395 [Prolixibacteraceae bacterium Z1-6]|uniref:Uncharacterized protein n=1 Tax=Draconibacterium aestuarii TaxID=2998507 RepID=A0A9X3F1L5_9BACT|nr:hypothetical protein [Prolixibacteraceae bacterium Z1-6]